MFQGFRNPPPPEFFYFSRGFYPPGHWDRTPKPSFGIVGTPPLGMPRSGLVPVHGQTQVDDVGNSNRIENLENLKISEIFNFENIWKKTVALGRILLKNTIFDCYF